ncbi:MAG: substrate-binding domain-containing protein [Candidatus Limnocylindrales bacterium]
MHKRRIGPSIAVIALTLGAACGGPGATTRPATPATTAQTSSAPASATTAPSGAGVSGEIVVSGSSTVEPISLAVSEDFKAQNPSFGYTVEGPGTGDGFALFCAGEIDVSDASRAIKDSESEACSTAAIDYTELKIAYDGITVMTHPDTPIDCLTTADLYALFGPESDGFANWTDAQVLATELGSATTLPDAPLQITAPGEESGTYDAFVELTGIGAAAAGRSQEEGVLRLPGANYTASPNDHVIVEGVEAGAGSLGFVGFAYFEEAGDNVKAIAIDEGDGCIEPSLETIADGTYPLSRPLFIYPNNAKADENAALSAWVDFYLSDAGITNVTDVGYVALPDDELQASRDAWANR